MRLLLLVLSVVLVCSCGPAKWYDHEVAIPETGWHKDTVAVFNSNITKLDESCHLLIQVSNVDQYSYSNLWLFVDAVSPSGNVQRDTLECILANHEGKWFGDKTRDTYKSLHPYKLNVRFPEEGLYKYYLVQGMRDTVLTGVKSIGVQIIETK
ncbi:gliding motility lipoprotein GldH [Plebeiibacterium marinum]|uniref:Gliding motility lipoprotein GldH n=1 Tax=Plebeiibacterium marinum TaxID=2992111 RepID=A0AAE3MFX9_9BACT|nr:gliding motility lipoprotein GldH [Plebeiobacterium marinum]MCW3806892.1 gliding motility lipoprotein GldH [Plebeiobacterium marinum]